MQITLELGIIVIEAVTILFLAAGYIFKVNFLIKESEKLKEVQHDLLDRVSYLEGKTNGKLEK